MFDFDQAHVVSGQFVPHGGGYFGCCGEIGSSVTVFSRHESHGGPEAFEAERLSGLARRDNGSLSKTGTDALGNGRSGAAIVAKPEIENHGCYRDR